MKGSPLMRRLAILAAALLAALFTTVAIGQSARAAALTATYTTVQDWGSGFEGKVTITNGTGSTVNGWNVQFDLPAGFSIGSYWNAGMTRSGQHYTFANPSWAPTLAAGASTDFGFNGSPGGMSAPANCTINGASCSGTTAPGAPGTPGTPTVGATTSSSLALSWPASSGTVTGYRVYEGSTVVTTVTGTSATISGLAACSSHTYSVTAYNGSGESAHSTSVTGSTTGCSSGGSKLPGAPYLYMGWGDPPSATSVMSASGIKSFTMAFMLAGGGCTPEWDSQRPLTGGVDASTISAIKSAGGSVEISFGGWQGSKLGTACTSSSAYAGAVQQVIDAYGPIAVDFDIENTDEFQNATVQDRILGGLKIIKQNNPNVKVVLTFGVTTSGPETWGNRLITQSKALGVNIDNYTIMPFDFGGGADMYGNTVNAAEGLKNSLKSAWGWSDATAYAHMGISGMNGYSDSNELTTPAIWTQIRDYATSHGLGRLAFWSVNRDRGCPGGGVVENCSGIAQNDWQFTQITAGF